MKRDYRKMNPYILAIPVLALGLQDSASACVSPAIASICESYPEFETSVVQLLVTVPSLTTCIVALLYGWLQSRINPRTLCICGLSLFVVGGILPVWLTNFWAILACRFVLGCGAGITLPACLSIIPRLYEGGMRENMMGWGMSAGAVGTTIMVFVGGHFANVNWHLSFLGYGIGVVSLILVVLLLPKIPPARSEDEERRITLSEMFHNAKGIVWLEIFVYFVGNMFATLVTSNLSLFVDAAAIGTPADTGNALSLQMVGAAVGAFFYGRIKMKIRYNIIPISWLVMGAGFFVVTQSTSVVGVTAGMIVAGVGVGVVWPAYLMRVTELCNPVAVSMMISVASAMQGFGNFFNPVVGAWCVALFGVNYGHDLIGISAGVLCAIGVAVFVLHGAGAALARKRSDG